MSTRNRTFLTLAVVAMAAFALTTSANAVVIGLTVDTVNTSPSSPFGTQAGLVNDPFAYGDDTGDSPSPRQDDWYAWMYYAGGVATVDIDFDQNYTGIDLDIWGRDNYGGAQQDRHQNLTITFYIDDTPQHQVTGFNGVTAKPTSYGRYTPPANVVANRVTITQPDAAIPLMLAEVRAIGDVPEPELDFDAADFITLKRNFGRTDTTLGAVEADFDVSGAVNWGDLSFLMTNIGTPAVVAPAVPEPATMGLLAIGALAVIRRRRRA